ncbi:MAG: hypothetical protein E7206_04750 [Clostridium beijerinckii]|nr:hypothetical protein [Clostridium beijerinckii]
MITNFDMLFYTMSFVVPGFIIYYIKAKFTPEKQDNGPNYAIKYIFYSTFNFALISPIVYWAFKSEYYKQHTFRAAGLWMIGMFFCPIMLGIILGIANQKEWEKKLLNKLNINPMHRIPTAWDYKFSNIKWGSWIIVTTKEDKRIMGLYSSNSFASSESGERDLYLEKYYTRNEEDNGWDEATNIKGILIKADQIKFLEFLELSEEEERNEQ